jgi:hypothetical protein
MMTLIYQRIYQAGGAGNPETEIGSGWLIPESDLNNFEPPKMGRPPKPKYMKAYLHLAKSMNDSRSSRCRNVSKLEKELIQRL